LAKVRLIFGGADHHDRGLDLDLDRIVNASGCCEARRGSDEEDHDQDHDHDQEEEACS
jgi:hypothetical protein